MSLGVVRVAVPGCGGGSSGGDWGGCQRWRWREFVRCRCGSRGRCCRRDSYDPVPFWEGREVGPWDGGSIPLITPACTAPTASVWTIPASVVLVVRWPMMLIVVVIMRMGLVEVCRNVIITMNPVVLAGRMFGCKWWIWRKCGCTGHMCWRGRRCGRIGTHPSHFLQESIYGSLNAALRPLQHLFELDLQLARHLGNRVLDPLQIPLGRLNRLG